MRQSLAMLVAAATTTGCDNRLAVQCEINSNCDLTSSGVCARAPNGNQWCAYGDSSCPSGLRYANEDVGDELAGSCVAGETYARPGEADLVLGQEDFTSMESNHGASGNLITARSLYYPVGVAVNDATESVWIADSANTRILGWEPAPIASFAAATVVVGQPTFDARNSNVISMSSFTSLDIGVGISSAKDKLIIPNSASHRVMIFSPIPTSNLPSASLVLGQTDFASSKTGTSASDFSAPTAAWTDGTHVAIADTFNNRVLIWNSFPTTNDQAANLVLGQPGFGMDEMPNPPTASSMNWPTGVYSDGARFYVSDMMNHRVLIWNTFPTSNGQPADVVLGQASFTTNESGTSATGLHEPRGIAATGNTLFIADTGNNRIVAFSPIPISSGSIAKYVIGQPDFNTRTAGVTREIMNNPEYLAIQGHGLYVTDHRNSRVLRIALEF